MESLDVFRKLALPTRALGAGVLNNMIDRDIGTMESLALEQFKSD